MAVQEQTPYIEHTGNGVTTSFSLGFQCESKDHLIVLVDDIEPPIASWSLVDRNVVFTTAPAAGKQITLQRNTPFSRTTDYQSYNNSFRPPAVNKDFDWIWWKLQELGVADWILGNRINALKNYVDRKDDELKAYLMEEIRKQGVALDQLDEYYNYLMQRLAQIAVDKGWDASFVITQSGDNLQQFINDQLSKTTLLLNISVTPEMYGAKGNGIDDDSAAVAAWWLSPFVHKQARGKYKVNLGNSGVLLTLTKSLEIDMVGAEFLPTEQARYFMRIDVAADVKSIIIKGGHTVSNSLLARNLEIFGEGRVGNISVSFNSATEIKENGQVGSASGLSIQAKADIIDVHHNDYRDINRTTINPGIVASVGISISNVVGTCLVYGNNIERVRTPVDADADGISIFSDNRLISPSQVQKVNIRVFNNKLRDCEGRFIKMQAPAQVYGNDFRSETGKLIPEFRAVDAQFGGVDVFGNEWRLASGVTGASTAMFCLQNLKGDTGSEDNVGSIVGNKLYLDQKIQYLAHVSTTGGKHVIRIKDNTIKDEDGILKVEDMVRFTIPSASAIDSLALSIENNELTLGTSALIVLYGAGFASSALNSKLALTIADNRPKGVVAGAKVIETSSEAANPYLGDILIKNNGDQLLSYNQIQARGMDVLKLRPGNQFYYATDGSTTGMLNCPTGYSRYVYVSIQSSMIDLTLLSGQKKAVKGNTATWYEYTGTTIV